MFKILIINLSLCFAFIHRVKNVHSSKETCTLPNGHTFETACTNCNGSSCISLDGNVTNSSCCLRSSDENVKISPFFKGFRKFDGGCNTQYNVYITQGNDVWKGSVDRHTCAQYCYFLDTCVGWSWKAATSYCWLKSDASKQGYEEGWYTGGRCLKGCPELKDIPVMYDSSRLTCGWMYQQPYQGQKFISCSDATLYTYPDGYALSAPAGQYFPFGSVFVKPGCNLYVFDDYSGTGNSKQVQGSILDVNNVFNGVKSFACRCDREPITCVPQDDWQTVLVCDNSDGKRFKADCTYTVTTGATYSEEHSFNYINDTSIDIKYHETINELFVKKEFEGFESLKTGFKWSSASTSMFTKTSTTTITDEAPKGYILTVQQAVGKCGGSEFRTNMIKLTQDNGTRKKSNVIYVKENKNE